jgi:hypothetical protein
LSRNAALAEARKLERVVLIELVGVEPLQLLDDIRGMAHGLLELANAAAAREPAEAEKELPEPETVDEVERAGVETNDTTAEDASSGRRKRGRAVS